MMVLLAADEGGGWKVLIERVPGSESLYTLPSAAARSSASGSAHCGDTDTINSIIQRAVVSVLALVYQHM